MVRLKVRDLLIALAVLVALANLSSNSRVKVGDDLDGDGGGQLRHHTTRKGGRGGRGGDGGGGGAAGDVVDAASAAAAADGGVKREGHRWGSVEDGAREQRRLEREAREREREQRQARRGGNNGRDRSAGGGGSSSSPSSSSSGATTTTTLRAATLANLKRSSRASRVERELDKTLGDFTSEIFDERNGTLDVGQLRAEAFARGRLGPFLPSFLRSFVPPFFH